MVFPRFFFSEKDLGVLCFFSQPLFSFFGFDKDVFLSPFHLGECHPTSPKKIMENPPKNPCVFSP